MKQSPLCPGSQVVAGRARRESINTFASIAAFVAFLAPAAIDRAKAESINAPIHNIVLVHRGIVNRSEWSGS